MTTIEFGCCQCGCGAKTTIAKTSHARKGIVKGYPMRFLHGHGAGYRVKPKKPYTGKYVGVVVHGRTDWEHRSIAARVLGHTLPPRAEVHHFDNNGRNNIHTNLVICQDRAYHMLLHKRQRVKAFGGDPNTDYWCSACKRPVKQFQFYIRRTGRGAGEPASVCKSCGIERSARWRRQLTITAQATAV